MPGLLYTSGVSISKLYGKYKYIALFSSHIFSVINTWIKRKKREENGRVNETGRKRKIGWDLRLDGNDFINLDFPQVFAPRGATDQ